MFRLSLATICTLLTAAAAAAPVPEPNQPTTAPVDMTASDVGVALTRMLLDKPKVPVTAPKGVAEPEAPVEVPVEGSMVVDRLCRLAYDGESRWFVLVFEPQQSRRAEMPRRALPCRLLEQVESLALKSPSVRFRVSGETTVHEERGYLLLTKATVLEEFPAAADEAPKPAPVVRPAPAEVKVKPPAPTSLPASRPAVEPSSDDILKKLLNEKVGRPVQARPVRPVVARAPSVAPGAGKPLAPGRGAMVVDRLVRVGPEVTGHWWAARFEADNTLREPPMRLLPCGFLARAQQMQMRRRLGADTVLRVSGLVTRYRGRRYLLLRKVLFERPLSRF